jgi:hypothetical protein
MRELIQDHDTVEWISSNDYAETIRMSSSRNPLEPSSLAPRSKTMHYDVR